MKKRHSEPKSSMSRFSVGSATLNPTTTMMLSLHSTGKSRRCGNSPFLFSALNQKEPAHHGNGKMTSGLHTIQEQFGGSHIPPPQTNKVIINVGGARFETYKSTLRNIPDTRLAWITESKADNPDYDPVSGEYFFDRHPHMFLMILNYYRTGKLHTPTDVCGPSFEEELLFWGIDEKQIESCCWGSYSQHRDAQHTLDELKIDSNNTEQPDFDDTQFGSTAEKFGITESEDVSKSCWARMKPKIWAVIDGHSGSLAAKIFTGISLFLTMTVITAFILETHPSCRLLLNASDPFPKNYTNRELKSKTIPHPALIYIEIVCMIELSIETLLRFLTCPSKKAFIRNPLNVFDIVALISFYINVVFYITAWGKQHHLALQFVRVFRVFRIFKMATHLPALKILFHTLKASARELILMIMLIFSFVVIFASFIYLAEQIQEDDQNDFASIPIGFWWAIVTMTTLGYGDKHPKTMAGYIVGSVCALCGVLFIALPIPIIVNNFSTYYNHAKAQEKLPKKRKVALVGAADALKQVLTDSTHLESRSDLNSEASSHRSRSSSPHGEESPMTNNNDSTTQLVKRDSKQFSNGSAVSSERTTRGISVTFTDVDEGEMTLPVPQHSHKLPTMSRYSNGLKPCKDSQPDIHVNGSVTTDNSNNFLAISPDNATRKKGTSNIALSRRASLLPGGVSNQTSVIHACDSSGDDSDEDHIDDETYIIITDEEMDINDDKNNGAQQKSSLTVKAAGPRERRRSLMPATYNGG